MPIIQAGKQFTADELQQTAGNLAAMLRDHATSGMKLKAQLETWTDPDLIELGLAQPEIDAIKGFFIGDLPAIYDALIASTWIKQLLGTGV